MAVAAKTRRVGFLSPSARRGVLILHLVASIGWLGVDSCLLVLGVAGLLGVDTGSVYPVDGLLATVLVPPLSLFALLSGLILAMGAGWGLARHWWVLVSLVTTVGIAVVANLVLLPMARTAADPGALVVVPLVILALLVFVTGANVKKPWGRRK